MSKNFPYRMTVERNVVGQRVRLQRIFVYHQDAMVMEIFADEEMATHLATLYPSAIIFIMEEQE